MTTVAVHRSRNPRVNLDPFPLNLHTRIDDLDYVREGLCTRMYSNNWECYYIIYFQ